MEFKSSQENEPCETFFRFRYTKAKQTPFLLGEGSQRIIASELQPIRQREKHYNRISMCDHLSYATTYAKHQNFPSLSLTVGTSRKRLPPVSDGDHYLEATRSPHFIFTRACVSHALLSLTTDGGLFVVYIVFNLLLATT